MVFLKYLIDNFSASIAWMWYFVLSTNDSPILQMEGFILNEEQENVSTKKLWCLFGFIIKWCAYLLK
jgi:hypothetical protein